MDKDLGSRNATRQGRHETSPKTVKKSLTNSSRNRSSSQQQPGRYLCVDTRKDQVFAPKVRPNSSYAHSFSGRSTKSKYFNKDVQHNVSTKKSLKTVQNRTVQPDSHCKFKTTLAIEYVRDILEENATNSRPISRRNSLKKNGQLKPLLSAGQLALGPNVTKCLGIQNDRQKKTVTLDNGLEVREEVITPDIARFSSATKHISQNTLTVDLRKLSLADQSETIALDNSIAYDERRQETNSQDEMKNPKSILIYCKNSDHDNDKNTDNRHWSDFSHNHIIDDNDQDIEDIIDHTVDLTSRQRDYNRYNQNIDGTDYVHDIRDGSSVKHQGDADYYDYIDDDNINHDDIGDDLVSDKATLNQRSYRGGKTFNEGNDIFEGFQDTNIIGNKNHKTGRHGYVNRNLTGGESSLTLNEESNPKIPEEKFAEPEQVTCSELLTSSRNSNTLSPKPTISYQDYKTTDENERVNQEPNLKHSNIDELRQNLGVRPPSNSSNSTANSLNQSSPDQDSIQVKDIWKALVDGGYDISREEVSKYKVNSTKPRIRSAPARRRFSQNINTFVTDVPTRAKSAMNRDDEERSGKECFADLDGEDDSEPTMKNPKVGAFMQEHALGTKVKPSQESFSNDQSSLEVVAVSKPVTKLLRKKNIPFVPPLNFQINTIPKSGHFFYFAYGLNMNQKRLKIQLRCQTGIRYWGLLFGFRLLFNKKGSAEGGVGFPNIVHEPGFSVEGCVYELSLDCLPLLDTCVGFPKHYSRLVVPVWMCNSLNADEHGVAQHCVPAVVYTAQDDWVYIDPAITLDTSFTLKQVVLGTDLLTSNYQTFIDGFSQRTATDGNPM